MRFYVEQFERYKAEGMEALKSGDRDHARFCLLKAGEFLYRMAEKSTGRLRESRVVNAHKLVEMARGIAAAHGGSGAAAEEKEGVQAEQFMVKEKPGVSFDEIAGLEDAKQRILVRVVYPLRRPELAERFRIRLGGGLLLYGPPGTGKTMLAKAVAHEVDAPFYTVRPSDILSKWVGEAEKNIARLFDEARSHRISVVFIDEVESLVPRRRSTRSSVMARLVPQILAELEGFRKGNPILFIGATNEPWLIDQAMLRPGRFDERVYVGLPDEAARRKIFEIQLAGRLCGEIDCAALAAATEGYSGADVRAVCEGAAERVFLESMKSGAERPITMADLTASLERVRPSVPPETLKRYEAYHATH